LVRCTVAAVLLGVLVVGSWLGYRYHGPTPPLEIYRGITYGCDVQPDTADGNGLVHWVRADLAVPGVRLYVTPIDADAKAAGWEYKLRRVSTVVADERLAAAVNGTRFESDSTLVRLAGDNARSSETAVANGVANHVDPNTYLMWWDRDGVAHAQPTKPPPPSVLSSAVWGIGMQQYLLVDGAVSFWAGHDRLDRCTAIGADPARHLVWIVCLDRASYFDAARELLRLGATIGGPVDGGTSTAMALGDEARDVRPGTVTGNWRPVATTFGFRADPLPE
jgi:hypothetical protein